MAKRFHAPEFKREAVRLAQQPGMSVQRAAKEITANNRARAEVIAVPFTKCSPHVFAIDTELMMPVIETVSDVPRKQGRLDCGWWS